MRLLLTTALLSLCSLALADSGKPVFGWVEKVALEPWGVEVKAKLDTGALTSSLHATNIEIFKKDGHHWVRFTVDVVDKATGKEVQKTYERPRYRRVLVRGAGGADHRPVVLMNVCVGNTIQREQFTLQDRSDMIYPMLIGRRTLQHLGLVDVTQTFEHPPQCGSFDKVHLHRGDDDADIRDRNPK
ncbi:MAG: ATP-dependent zinc protease [Alcanivorax sp.]|nr:ATP-dependent zinc protease [Alcanivorax sp.]